MFDKKIITRTVLLLSLVSLFNDIASEIIIPVMPVFLKSIGFSFFLIGILEGISEAVAGFSKGYFGNLSDHIGKRLPFVQFGYALSAVAKSSLAFFSTVIPVFLSKVGDKIGKGVRKSARDAMLSDASPPGKKATVFGFHRSMDTVGAVIGPLLALIYLHYHPAKYQSLFAITFIPGIIVIGITFLIKEKKSERASSEKKQPGFFSFLKYWKQSSKSYKIIVIGLLSFTLLNSSDAFLLLTIKNKGYSDQYMIGIYIFYNLIFALLSYPIGALTDKLGMMKTIIASLLIFSIVYFVIAFAESLIAFVIIFSAYSIYAAGFDSTTKAIITEHCKKEQTGTALGFYGSCSSLLAILASSWTGFVWTHFNSQTAFIISASGVLLIALFFLFNYKTIAVSS
jgi:MFS family permease